MLWDCHIHMVLDGSDWKTALARHRERPDDRWIRRVLETYRSLGVTYLRDGGDRWGVGKRARALAADYGITYRTPLSPLCRVGHYGSFIGTSYGDMAEYAALAAAQRDSGADFIKIMISGLMDFHQYGVLTQESLPPEEIRELVAVAHGEGLSVMAHANGDAAVEAAARAGVDSVEHGAYLTSRALEAMGAAGTIWVPTLSTIGNLRGKGRFPEAAVARILDSALENVSAFAAMGGLLAPGSDAGAWGVHHGSQSEIPLLRQAIGSGWEAVLRRGADALQARF